jgi:hypothetical protein
MLFSWRYVQEELRRQVGAAAFHQHFAASLSLLLEDARGALAELHLTVSSMLAHHRQHTQSSAMAAGHTTAVPDSAGNAAAAQGIAQSAECVLSRAAACHGNLPLGRLRQYRAVQTAYCELWSLAAGPWGRNDVRREVYNVMTGRAPPDSSLRALASACHAASPPSGHSSSSDPISGDVGTGSAPVHGVTESHDDGAATDGQPAAAAADSQLRKAPPAAAILRLVQTIYAAKAAADAAARTARKQPVPLYAVWLHSSLRLHHHLYACLFEPKAFVFDAKLR